jgi:Na+-transporting NADH:ubiquinone oxidoreductase subunit NqrF
MVQIKEPYGNQGFAYSMVLYSRKHTRSTAKELQFAKPVRDTISPALEIESYIFNGTAGDKITLCLGPDGCDSHSDDPNSYLQILAPNDSVVISSHVSELDLNEFNEFELLISGLYIVQIKEPYGNQGFVYSLFCKLTKTFPSIHHLTGL